MTHNAHCGPSRSASRRHTLHTPSTPETCKSSPPCNAYAVSILTVALPSARPPRSTHFPHLELLQVLLPLRRLRHKRLDRRGEVLSVLLHSRPHLGNGPLHEHRVNETKALSRRVHRLQSAQDHLYGRVQVVRTCGCVGGSMMRGGPGGRCVCSLGRGARMC
eukprot:354526-Chlamydomonas_euryale.AAC.9